MEQSVRLDERGESHKPRGRRGEENAVGMSRRRGGIPMAETQMVFKGRAGRVVYCERVGEEGRGERRRARGRGGLTLGKVRHLPSLSDCHPSSRRSLPSCCRTDCEEAVARATSPVAMETTMCEGSVSRTQTKGSGPNRTAPARDWLRSQPSGLTFVP